jgi:glycosyltransferase involved in cell wall biosynthesis
LELAGGDYDLADYEYAEMGPYAVSGMPSVLTVHELGYTAILNSAFGKARAAEDAIPDLDRFIRSFHYFASVLPSICNRLITLSDEDAAGLTTFTNAYVYTSPSGVAVRDAGEEVEAPGSDAAPVFAYAGNFRHPPNVQAALFFAKQVMPLVRQVYPAAEFRIYGAHASGAVAELDGKNGVRLMGFVEDLVSALRGAAAVVAPIFTGTGQRIKVLEALGAGALVIGTDLSVRSIRVEDRKHYLRANSAEEFGAAALWVVEHPAESRLIAEAGQQLARGEYSWQGAAARREAIWFDAVGAGADQASSTA